MTYGINQREWLKLNPDIKVGNKILISKNWNEYEPNIKTIFCWKSYFTKYHADQVGKELTILEINPRRGFLLDCSDIPELSRYYSNYRFYFPYCILGKNKSPVDEIYIILPDKTEKKVKTIDDAQKFISKLSLTLDKKDKVWFRIGGYLVDALNTYNSFLDSKPTDFKKMAIIF